MIAINQLHGITECGAASTENCQAADRMTILFRYIEEAGCPELVGLTEVARDVQGVLLPNDSPTCATGRTSCCTSRPTRRTVMILTSLPIVANQTVDTAGPPWEAGWVQVESDLGPIDFLMTHFASSSFNPPCDAELCPPICETGVEMGTCKAVEVVDFLEQNADPEESASSRGTSTPRSTAPGWPRSATRGTRTSGRSGATRSAIRRRERGCTCCVAGPPVLDGLDAPDITFDERIDFILARTPEGCELAVDTLDDLNDNGTSAGVFAGTPSDPPVNGIYWPADHAGVQAELFCS